MTEKGDEKRTSHGMIFSPEKKAYMPCAIEVRVSDGQPLAITQTAAPIENGRYTLLAPGWDVAIARVNGEWQIGKQTHRPGKDPEEIAALSPAQAKERNREIKKRLLSFGGPKFAKSVLGKIKDLDKDRDHDR